MGTIMYQKLKFQHWNDNKSAPTLRKGTALPVPVSCSFQNIWPLGKMQGEVLLLFE